MKKQFSSGFTIVELIIVVVVIAILASIVIVAYNGITSRARQSVADEGASQNRTKLALIQAEENAFPVSASGVGLGGTYEYTQTGGGTGYCLTTYSDPDYNAATKVETGILTSDMVCTGHTPIGGTLTVTIADGSPIQTITDANCPTDRTRAVDARDNHTYWVQQLADGKCWMLTNLGYAGGGTNTYGDTKTLTNGTGGSLTYTTASYYVVPSTTNFTTEPTAPSTATNGTGQYGYLYNWCAAKGVQADTNACLNATTPASNANISICPAGWRLPVGNGGDFTALNNAVNGGLTNTDAGLRTAWLAQRSGDWVNGFSDQGSDGYYWSATQYSATSAHYMPFSNSSVYPADSDSKRYGYAVRCIAN